MSETCRLTLSINGKPRTVDVPPMRRLSKVLREDLGLRGTKVGCDAGDCGACTVLIDGKSACSCMIPVGSLSGREIVTVEGLSEGAALSRLQRAFHHFGAAQCGICTPGMLGAATALLQSNPRPSEAEVVDAIGGVLCRCTGYRKIVEAVVESHRFADAPELPAAGSAVGSRLQRVDGIQRVDGSETYGDDVCPPDALWVRVIRSPHAHARFTFGDFAALRAKHPGIVDILTAKDVPGVNRFGVIPGLEDQPALAEQVVLYRGDAVAAVVMDTATNEAFVDADFPVSWEPLEAAATMEQALAADAMHPSRPGNILTRGLVQKGAPDAALESSAVVAEGRFVTSFVEHAYIEPEAGFARRVGDVLEVYACTQAPHMDRDAVAAMMDLPVERVRIVPTAVGGGFGGKLDISLQPYVAIAAWRLGRPVRCLYTRNESMASSTKRHPADITARIGADKDGRLTAMVFDGDFNTGAYASWGPTVANRVPVHCTGPYLTPALRARTRAVHTNNPPAGAFRGFGVPQAAIAQEALFDELAGKLGMDRLTFRRLNAIKAGEPTATSQVLTASVGMSACFDALAPHWHKAVAEVEAFNRTATASRRGVGVAGMWYGCGNTSLPNPSTMRVGLRKDGKVVLFQGAVDIGQGSNTVMSQICADAVGVDIGKFVLVNGDTAVTPDAGKTSASRQTFVSGRAAQLAGEDLRHKLLRFANAGDAASLRLDDDTLIITDGGQVHEVALAALPCGADGLVAVGEGTFDPPTSKLDANGQGDPYATYGFGAQIAEVEVDLDLGTVKVLKIVAAHDVGRAVNPTLLEGQIEGGVAQGIGMALMEEYIPGRTENLHDYLIPTAGDIPPIESILIEDAEPLGPFGAKGIGEHVLIPTAPAIFGAIRHASGAVITRVPATPERVLTAIRAAQGEKP